MAALESDGRVLAAGWTVGVAETVAWLEQHAGGEVLAFVDAPLVVLNQPRTQRLCEEQVGQRYGGWKVAANSTSLGTRHLAGVTLRCELEARGWAYDDGLGDSLPEGSRSVSECYPYTTLVGARELGYDHERPLYKRKRRRLSAADWRPRRAAACDLLVRRIDALSRVRPAPDLRSNPVTQSLLEPSPLEDRAYKHGEDLIDALLAAWTAALWRDHRFARCQVLGCPPRAAASPDDALTARHLEPIEAGPPPSPRRRSARPQSSGAQDDSRRCPATAIASRDYRRRTSMNPLISPSALT